MSVTLVGIANSALIKVGADRISSLTQDTKSAIVLNAIFDFIRDEVLRAHPWNFAIKRATISPTATTPPFEYTYEYDLPSDCLRVLNVYPESIPWSMEGNRKILSNEPTLDVIYVFRATDPTQWDSSFGEVMALRLAAEVAYNLTQSLALADTLMKLYRAAIAEARSYDGTEGTLIKFVADDWTNQRR